MAVELDIAFHTAAVSVLEIFNYRGSLVLI